MNNRNIMTALNMPVVAPFLLLFGVSSCDQKTSAETEKLSDQSEGEGERPSEIAQNPKALQSNDGVTIDGYKWTVGSLSDSFDADLTIEKAHLLFGPNPLVKTDEDYTMLTYTVESGDLNVPGVRITSFDLLFDGQTLGDVRFGFTTYLERSPEE